MVDWQQPVQVHNTKLHIQRFGLGAAHIPKQGEATAIETVQFALEAGVQLIDTAPLYSAGQSEIYIGQAVAGIPRERYVLATKVGRLLREGQPIFDYSREGVLRSLAESLARLRIDYVDILHIHDADNHYEQALDEAFPTLADLRSQGIIKAIGAGMNQWEMLLAFARNADFDCFLLAGRYTLLEQTSLEFLAYCQEKNISVILGGVYNSSILASNIGSRSTYNYSPAPAEILQKAQRLEAICQQHAVPLNVAALQFPLAHPAVASMVIGAEEKGHVAANIAALETPIPAALWADLQASGLLAPGTPTPD